MKRYPSEGVVEHGLGQQLLQPSVLVLQRPQPPGLGLLQTAVLGLSLAEGGTRHPMLAAHIRRRMTGLLLLQEVDDGLHQNSEVFRFQVTGSTANVLKARPLYPHSEEGVRGGGRAPAPATQCGEAARVRARLKYLLLIRGKSAASDGSEVAPQGSQIAPGVNHQPHYPQPGSH